MQKTPKQATVSTTSNSDIFKQVMGVRPGASEEERIKAAVQRGYQTARPR